MIEHLATLVENFPGAANQTRCFTHILNLVAKSILRQFDLPKKTGANDRMDLDDAANALAGLAQELEELPKLENDGPDDDEEAEDEMGGDDDEDFGDGRDGMSELEVGELEKSLIPIRLMLTKVSFNII
jgi:hypothetical protein